LQFRIRSIFYLAIIPGLLAFFMILLVQENPITIRAKSKIDVGLGQFPRAYWKYLLVTAVFGLGNSSNSFLILETQGIGASVELTFLIYAGFNFVAALVSYPAGSLSDRWGRRNVLLMAFIICSLPTWVLHARETSPWLPLFLSSMDCFRGYSGQSVKRWHRTSCPIISTPARSAGTTQH